MGSHIFIGLVTFERDEQYLSLFLDRLLQQDYPDWSLHCVDTTVAGNPAAAPYAPKLRERLAAILPPDRFSVEEYSSQVPGETTWVRVANARNQLRERFLASDAPLFFFVDGDILLPPSALSTLSSHQAPAVSGVYLSVLVFRNTSLGHDVTKLSPVAWIKDPADPAKARPLMVLDVIPERTIPLFCAGFGCVLFSRDVLSRFAIPHPSAATGTEDLPFYVLLDTHRVPVLLDTRVKCAHLRFPLGDPRNAQLDFANYRLQIKKRE